ncbi:tetratricopeptide repeat protein [Marinactinospora rubrisoli]|uniref:Tetratricopeptide repeat protein n=1 Tax=Marinactinospora rubrisoli TaxID=2715399 RepID=A0ABW2KHG5_9ACTN
MTATPGAPAPDTASDDPDFAILCDQARDLARTGHLDRAARVFEQVLAGGEHEHRAAAAFGLAVVRHDLGDVRAAREADRTAIATGHSEYAARAAYHLAVSYEDEGDGERAHEAWREVLATGNERYTAAARHGLARIAEDRGDAESAREHWDHALAGDSPAVADAAQDYAERLLARGDTDTADAVIRRGLEVAEHAGLRLLLGAVHVERAIAEFGAAAAAAAPVRTPDGDPGDSAASLDAATAGAAVELLARLLAVRGDADGAADAWEQGLRHPDPEVATEVRTRLRRGFLTPDPETAETESAAGPPWWEPFVEAAVAQDSTPMLAGELFVALNQIYTRLAVAHAGNETHAATLRGLVEWAVRTPGEYVWGRALHDDFRERLRIASGSAADVLPEGWPDE